MGTALSALGSVASAAVNIARLAFPSNLPFSLGPITFKGVEIPANLPGLGGMQVLETHDFPGGIRTVKAFGPFPREISWKGILLGNQALPRSFAIDRVRAAGSEVVLTYGQYQYSGFVAEYIGEVKNQWYVDYTLTFMPRVDLSGTQQPGSLEDPEQLMQTPLTGLQAIISNTFGITFPVQLITQITNVLTTVMAALLTGQGLIQNINGLERAAALASIQTFNAAAQTQLLQHSLDPITVSPILDAMSMVAVINLLLQNSTVAGWQVQLVNPDLPALAAQYYGDATLWTSIARANSMSDPTPVGTFNLIIPANPQIAATSQ